MSDVMFPDLIDESTNFILVNTVYFKPRWLHIFDEKDTEQQVFHASTTEKYLVPTMFKDSIYKYGIMQSWHCRFIEIPYLNEDMVMIILLPNREITLETLENNFNWQTLINTQSFPDPILLYLPKFKFEINIDIKNVLRKIGLKMMFQDQANFTRLSKSPLKVSRVLQKMSIEVNEKGSEFPAAKVVNVEQTLKWNKRIRRSRTFIVNRPFMFAIEHKPTRMPLFLGSIRKPDTNSRFVRPRNDEL
ncbi:Antichymotrypsin-2-like isoform X3 [Camponotus japonicus]